MPDEEQTTLINRFHNDTAYHPPSSDEIRFRHERVRENIHGVGQALLALTFPGRERSLMLTKLEEAMFWANASIARNQ